MYGYHYGLGQGEMWFMLIVSLLFILPMLWVLWRIMWKCTGRGWLALLLFLPVVNLFILAYAAFSPTPDLSPRLTVAQAPPPAEPTPPVVSE